MTPFSLEAIARSTLPSLWLFMSMRLAASSLGIGLSLALPIWKPEML